jgi:hypothetical protein
MMQYRFNRGSETSVRSPIELRFLSIAAVIAISGIATFADSASAASAAEVNRQFTLAPGGSVCFTYPEAGSNQPVQIMVSTSSGNGGTQTPSALVSAVVMRDTTSKQFTWIGTNGDGTTKASTQLSGNVIATGAFSNFLLMTCTATGKSNQLELSQSGSTTTSRGTYYVTMFY